MEQPVSEPVGDTADAGIIIGSNANVTGGNGADGTEGKDGGNGGAVSMVTARSLRRSVER
mgnify:CR=1 FL=1